jgi:hypothetical protein
MRWWLKAALALIYTVAFMIVFGVPAGIFLSWRDRGYPDHAVARTTVVGTLTKQVRKLLGIP